MALEDILGADAGPSPVIRTVDHHHGNPECAGMLVDVAFASVAAENHEQTQAAKGVGRAAYGYLRIHRRPSLLNARAVDKTRRSRFAIRIVS